MKKILLIVLCLAVPAFAGTHQGWIESSTFQEIQHWYGMEIPYNDKVFDCEDFTYWYLAECPMPARVGVIVTLPEGKHMVAGFITSQGCCAVEPQNGKCEYGKSFEKAARLLYPKTTEVVLVSFEELEKYIWG